jgi:hypothetical protein
MLSAKGLPIQVVAQGYVAISIGRRDVNLDPSQRHGPR